MAPPARLGGGTSGLANSNRPYLDNDDESGERTEAYRKRRVRASFYEKAEIARRPGPVAPQNRRRKSCVAASTVVRASRATALSCHLQLFPAPILTGGAPGQSDSAVPTLRPPQLTATHRIQPLYVVPPSQPRPWPPLAPSLLLPGTPCALMVVAPRHIPAPSISTDLQK